MNSFQQLHARSFSLLDHPNNDPYKYTIGPPTNFLRIAYYFPKLCVYFPFRKFNHLSILLRNCPHYQESICESSLSIVTQYPSYLEQSGLSYDTNPSLA